MLNSGVVNKKDLPLSDQPSSFLAWILTSYLLPGSRPKKVKDPLKTTPSYLEDILVNHNFINIIIHLSLEFLFFIVGIIFVQSFL